jgi:hypothetical protein
MNALELLISQIEDKANQIQEAMIYGNIDSFEEYKFLCGELRGLLTAREYIKDLKNKMETQDE